MRRPPRTDQKSVQYPCFPIRAKACQAPFCPQFFSTASLQTKYKVENHVIVTPLNLIALNIEILNRRRLPSLRLLFLGCALCSADTLARECS